MPCQSKHKLESASARQQGKMRLMAWPAVANWHARPEQYCDYRLDGQHPAGWVRAKQYANGTLFLEAETPLAMAALEEILQLRGHAPTSSSTLSMPTQAIREAKHGALTPNLSGIVIGQDESGKGDYFGPLVVASCRVRPEQIRMLQEKGVSDCKQLSDAKVRELANWLPTALGKEAMAVTRLSPRLYNQLYARFGNLNTLLAWVHGRTLERLLGHQKVASLSALTCVIDQFASNQSVITRQLRPLGKQIAIHQQPRAESIPAVAAASILARAAFLEGLDALSRQVGVALHPGAGAPTMASAKKLAQRFDAR
ncbi:MAG: ribonuclease HIII, partial [Vampirovibrionales bacterium]|nr:ribonuclease HIII [Vampirovibrionales bacterium]